MASRWERMKEHLAPPGQPGQQKSMLRRAMLAWAGVGVLVLVLGLAFSPTFRQALFQAFASLFAVGAAVGMIGGAIWYMVSGKSGILVRVLAGLVAIPLALALLKSGALFGLGRDIAVVLFKSLSGS